MTEYKSYAECNYNKALEILRELGKIPAPSHYEDKRAEFCRDFLKSFGADNAYIDNAKNVIYEINCESSNDITVFLAHTDTVFPDTEPYTMTEDEEKIYCPGIGDDTASVVVLLMLAKYYTENRINPKNGVMFVIEDLENLVVTSTVKSYDLDRVQVGMKVKIETDATGKDVFYGELEDIRPLDE